MTLSWLPAGWSLPGGHPGLAGSSGSRCPGHAAAWGTRRPWTAAPH